MRSLLRIVGVIACVALLGAGVVSYFLYRAARHVPEFYVEALETAPECQEIAGDELERHVLELNDELRRPGQWEMTFSEAEINGWLAFDLPQKFAAALPAGVREPRVSIQPDAIYVACRYEAAKISTVVSLAFEVGLTDEPNVITVRVRQARAGALPLPLRKFLDKIGAAAQRADLELRWQQNDGDPVALLKIPEQHERYVHRVVRIERVELRAGELFVAGYTGDEPELPERTAAFESPLNVADTVRR